MKKCPQCGREYDLSMSFCLDDGTELLYGPASEPPSSVGGQSGDEPQTAILHQTAPTGEGDTRAHLTSTGRTVVLPSADMPAKRRSKIPIVIAPVLLIAIGAAAWYLIPRKSARPGMNMLPSKLLTGLKGTPGNVGISPDG